MNNYLVIDLETTDDCSYDRIGNPFTNKILALGYKDAIDHVALFHTDVNYSELPNNLQYKQLLIGHNIKFDLLYLWKLPMFQKWLYNGGKIWDTQIVEYWLTSFKHKYPALRDIAVNKYGCTERIKNIDNLVFNKETAIYKSISSVPKEFIIADVLGDVADTEQVYLQQLQLVKQLGLESIIKRQMEMTLALTEMEFNGFKINLDILKVIKNNLIVKSKELEDVLLKQIGNILHENTTTETKTI